MLRVIRVVCEFIVVLMKVILIRCFLSGTNRLIGFFLV